MGSLAAPQALDVGGGNGAVIISGVVAAIVLICAAVGLNAWFRVRRIDRAAQAAGFERPAAPAPVPASPAPADDLPEDPDYQGPGDWDGGPADPPEFRTPPADPGPGEPSTAP